MCEHTPATPNPGEANLTTCCAHSVKRYTWRFPNLYSPMWIYRFIVIVILFIEEILQQLGRCYNFLNDWIMYQPQQVSAHFFHQPVGWLGTRHEMFTRKNRSISGVRASVMQCCEIPNPLEAYEHVFFLWYGWMVEEIRRTLWYGSLSIPLFVGFSHYL